VTITVKGSSTIAASTSATNTITTSVPAPGTDTVSTNNTATVVTNFIPGTLLSITKTNSISTVSAGQTFNYVITVVNSGPNNAPGALLTDPAATGIQCTAISCATAGTASCPAPLTVAALQSTGLSITPTFNANSTVSFTLTCGVTATGQ
jgi:uncharacterized repeat protein (TIGR01451 family)